MCGAGRRIFPRLVGRRLRRLAGPVAHLVHGERLLGLADIVAGHRQHVVPARQLDLEVDEVLPAERGFRAGEVELPHAAEAFVVDRLDLVAVGHEALAPRLQRLGIVQPQDFDVGDREAGALDMRHHLRQRRDVAAGEDVLADEGVGGGRRRGAADGVQQHHPVRLQQRGAFVEEGAVLGDADMLEHADRDDAVEPLRQVAVVAQLDMDVVVQPLRARSLGRHLMLLGGKGDAEHIGLERPGDVDRQPAPAAADVQHVMPGLDAQLCRDVPFLDQLRLFERHVGALEIGAGILHVLVEEQFVEVPDRS